jgi:hypothetical protein
MAGQVEGDHAEGDYLAGMPRLPRWLPRNPGCGCLLLLFVAIAVVLLLNDG